ncbi:NETI motif-containing protein [Peribacillus tepidiphilus]|jgi:hypothetical protein|uniref:NETI motif-containing protein n=1 Tax=Peribacillus tepidiphilus TaxID=2652445 RepID=UPI0012928DC6|nr:NETI motif-containing protein [Peribacillus tepidiphilus]
MKQSNKKTFEVGENESIDACLDRIRKEGYMPIKRIEKPIFKEVIQDGKSVYEPISRKILFETKKIE